MSDGDYGIRIASRFAYFYLLIYRQFIIERDFTSDDLSHVKPSCHSLS